MLAAALAGGASTLRAGDGPPGSITGRVVDSTGAVLPGVGVDAQPEGGGPVHSTQSTNDGYRFDALSAGRWEVSFRLPNFASSVTHDVVVRPGAETRLDTTLRLKLTAQVLVTARATFRDLCSAERGQELLGVASTASSGVVTEAQDRGPAGRRSRRRLLPPETWPVRAMSRPVRWTAWPEALRTCRGRKR
ncbi:MAG TPA: carboxypeptidase-like regulatory domain-containing protein [Vicinamibacteria bacterium]|nr:carboxypeptidase-like regulatory domain-containing protein [Vicinamibacteria bacterium]